MIGVLSGRRPDPCLRLARGALALINAAAEAVNRLFKSEVVRRHGPWRTLEHVEIETLKWVDWYNQRRLHSWCGDVPPIEYENAYYAAHNPSPATVEGSLTRLSGHLS